MRLLSLSELLLRCVTLVLGHPDLWQIQRNLIKSRLSPATPGALRCISSWGSGVLLVLSVDLGVSPHSSWKMLVLYVTERCWSYMSHLHVTSSAIATCLCVNPFLRLLLLQNFMSCSWLLNAYKFMAVTLEKDRRAVMGLSSLSFWTHFYCNALVSSIAELPDVFNNTLVRSLCKSGKH